MHRNTGSRIALIALLAWACAALAAPPAGPHGERGVITRRDGRVYISYTFVAGPGVAGTPAVFEVFRPRADPPAGLPPPRLLPGELGSWAFIGQGSLMPMSAMMNLDADGIVTWTFMTPAQLGQYRPTAAGSTSDPNFPLADEMTQLAPNDFGAGDLLQIDRDVLFAKGRLQVDSMQKFGRGGSAGRIERAYEDWKDQRSRACTRGGVRATVDATEPAMRACMIAKTRERLALYQRAIAEVEGGTLSDETRAAVGLQ